MVAARGKVPLALPLIRQSLEGAILLRRALAKVGHFSIGIDNASKSHRAAGNQDIGRVELIAIPLVFNMLAEMPTAGQFTVDLTDMIGTQTRTLPNVPGTRPGVLNLDSNGYGSSFAIRQRGLSTRQFSFGRVSLARKRTLAEDLTRN